MKQHVTVPLVSQENIVKKILMNVHRIHVTMVVLVSIYLKVMFANVQLVIQVSNVKLKNLNVPRVFALNEQCAKIYQVEEPLNVYAVQVMRVQAVISPLILVPQLNLFVKTMDAVYHFFRVASSVTVHPVGQVVSVRSTLTTVFSNHVFLVVIVPI